MNNTLPNKRKEIQDYMRRVAEIPYVLFINELGHGFTLNRQYKLLHANIGDWKGMPRHVISGMLPLASKVEQGYPLTDREAIPSWVSRFKISQRGHEFKTYWFDIDPMVIDAFFEPEYESGVTKHYASAKGLNQEISARKAVQRAEITKQYREEFRIRKPFFSDGMIRFYLQADNDDQQNVCTQWNDNWWSTERFTNKELGRVIESIKKFLLVEKLTGVFHIHLEGQYCACTSFEEAEAGLYEPWGDHFQINHIVTIKI